MKKFCSTIACLTLLASVSISQFNPDSVMIRSIFNEVLANGECYENLRYLCKDIGARLSGSEEADKAIVWGKLTMEGLGMDTVYLQPVIVPHWTRGSVESGYLIDGEVQEEVQICALGGSVGTVGKLRAQVIEVKHLEELAELGREKVEGKIVFFNRALDPLLINTGAAYGGAFDQRSKGASEAARYGAVGALVRSLTHALDTFPHTGAMNYEEGVTHIPAAAISTVDARMLHGKLKENPEIEFQLQLSCQNLPNVEQYNVIGELRGSENPDEYIVVGGHLDSWDIGEGAHDDGAGIVQSMEVARTFLALNYQPKHTLRVVLFINEENGNNGGKTYAKVAEEKGETHVAAIESDSGGFTPRGYSMEGTDHQYATVKGWQDLLEPYNLHLFRRGWSGVDIRPLKNDRVALFGLIPDSQRYFDFHHSRNDVFEQVHKRELELGASSIAALIYLLDSDGISPNEN
jgi:carboxypeptidase Q